MTSAHGPSLTVIGAAWCPHCKRVKKFLAAHRVGYTSIDIDADPRAIARLKELQAGGQIIPTVIYPDGSHEVNPSDEVLAARLEGKSYQETADGLQRRVKAVDHALQRVRRKLERSLASAGA